ncbi:MAG: hypothetical protein ACTSU9_13000, partial [Promethearchaeota archaeon]
GWSVKAYSAKTIDIANNFANTTVLDTTEVFHLETRDGSGADGFNYMYVRTYLDISSISNLLYNLKIQGKRYNGAYDTSFAALKITPDTDGDGDCDLDDDSLEYVFDDDGDLTSPYGDIDERVFGNVIWVWVDISSDWDGSTWYPVSRNVSQDWLDYHNDTLDGDICEVFLLCGTRVDASAAGVYYMWTNWDNLTISMDHVLSP